MQGDPERLSGFSGLGQPAAELVASGADVEHEHLAGQVVGDHARRRPQSLLRLPAGWHRHRLAVRQRPQHQPGQRGLLQRLRVAGDRLGQHGQQHGGLVGSGWQPLQHGRRLGQQIPLTVPDQAGETAVAADLLEPGEVPALRGQRAAPRTVQGVLELPHLGGALRGPVPHRTGQGLDRGAQVGRGPGPVQRGLDLGQRDAERGAAPDAVAEQPRRRPALLSGGTDQRDGTVDRLPAFEANPDPVDQPAQFWRAQHPLQPLRIACPGPAGRVGALAGRAADREGRCTHDGIAVCPELPAAPLWARRRPGLDSLAISSQCPCSRPQPQSVVRHSPRPPAPA
jgi:hypothetical protein